MNRSAIGGRLAVALALILLLVALASPGCRSDGVLRSPAVSWVSADRATYDVVAPRLRAYLEADPELELDPVKRTTLLELLDDWRLRLEANEATLGQLASAGAGAVR